MKTVRYMLMIISIVALSACSSSRDTTRDTSRNATSGRTTTTSKIDNPHQRRDPSAINTEASVRNRTQSEMNRNVPGRDEIQQNNNQPIVNRNNNRDVNRGFSSDAERNKAMYEAAEMNQSQIDAYEKQWKSFADPRDRNWDNQMNDDQKNEDNSINNYEWTENQDRILRDILDDNQFAKYQNWARKHPRSGE